MAIIRQLLTSGVGVTGSLVLDMSKSRWGANATNAGTVTDLRTTTVNYREVTAILDPRIVRFGLRVDF